MPSILEKTNKINKIVNQNNIKKKINEHKWNK